jgi:hypothetical protein
VQDPKETRVTRSKKPQSTWSYEEGRLTVKHREKTVSLGRYATRELAAKAAARYFADHADEVASAETSSP